MLLLTGDLEDKIIKKNSVGNIDADGPLSDLSVWRQKKWEKI